MQYLRIFPKPTEDGEFDVYWTNTELNTVRGIVHVIVPNMEDRLIIAELVALQYLLEEVEVIGRHAAGSKKTTLIVNSGAIKKLARKVSDKQAIREYGRFLMSRFSGCNIEVEKKSTWTEDVPVNADRVTLDASVPPDETIVIYGLGDVSVTNHVAEVFAERLSEKNGAQYTIAEAWRELRKIAADSAITKVDRSTARKRISYAMKGGQEGEYYVHPYKKWILVCNKTANQNKFSLVTAYPDN
jgi:hypothetical protein